MAEHEKLLKETLDALLAKLGQEGIPAEVLAQYASQSWERVLMIFELDDATALLLCMVADAARALWKVDAALAEHFRRSLNDAVDLAKELRGDAKP